MYANLLTLPRSMRSRVYVTVGCPSVPLSCRSITAVVCSWFAAECLAAPRTSYRLISAAGTRAHQQMRVASC